MPSALFLTDVLLHLDGTLDKKLLIAKKDSPEALLTKRDLAGREAGKLKKLMSALRYLFRNGTLARYTIQDAAGLVNPEPYLICEPYDLR